MSRDAGQVDFATVASVRSLNMNGDLEIGTLCLNVLSGGASPPRTTPASSAAGQAIRRRWGTTRGDQPSQLGHRSRLRASQPSEAAPRRTLDFIH